MRTSALVRYSLITFGILAVIVVLLFVRALGLKPQPRLSDSTEKITFDELAAARRLARVLTSESVSYQEPSRVNGAAFRNIHERIRQDFPRVNRSLKREVVNNYSLLYEWRGADPSLRPALFSTHLDVVPVAHEGGPPWKFPPFAGRIEEGFVWGRGAIDDKNNVVGILEAIELLLAQGYVPRRTVYLAVGHDEEVGGFEGAAKIAELLKSRGVQLEFVLDEGGYITEGVLPDVKSPVALVGIAEKGYVTLELTARAKAGHSSMPPKVTAIGALSEGIFRLQSHPFPRTLDGAMKQTLEALAGDMPFFKRLIIANLWLFEPLVIKGMSAGPTGSASLQTTYAPTIFHAGEKENVLPAEAKGTLNFRTLPGTSIQYVRDYVQNVVRDLPIEVQVARDSREPSKVSSTANPAYRLIDRLVRELYPGTLVAPYLFVGGSDSGHYRDLTTTVYRFCPTRFTADDLPRLHGTNERIAVSDYAAGIRFFANYLKNLP